MTNLVTRWRQEQQDAYEREQLRAAYLRGPMPKNPPELIAPTKVRVLKPFHVGGEPAKVGQIVVLPRADAESMAALRKAELI
jgi:hypothetical protein